MANLAKFKTLLSQYAAEKHSIPCVVLNQSTDIGQAFNKVVTLDNRAEGETDQAVTERYVEEICSSLEKEENSNAVQLFDATVEGLTTKIKSAVSSIEGIRDNARELAADMEKRASEAVAKDQYVIDNQKFQTLSEDFATWTWEGTKTIGAVSYVIEAVHSSVVHGETEIPKEPDAKLFELATSKLDKDIVINPVELSEDEKKATLEFLKELCADLSAEAIAEAFDILIGEKKFADAFEIIARHTTRDAGRLFEDIQVVDDFVQKMYPIVDAINTDQVTLPEAKADAIKANAKTMSTFCEYCVYYENMMRTSIFRTALLLRGGLINEDNWAAFQEAGGSKTMIANYIRYMYRDEYGKIPASGITVSAITNNADDVATKVTKEISGIKHRIKLAQTDANVMAFENVARELVLKKIARDNENIESGEAAILLEKLYLKAAKPVAETIRDFDVNFLDASVALIIGLDYEGTFVQHLQKKLGAAYIARAEEVSELTAEDIRQVDARVIAGLVCEFIVNVLVEPAPCLERESKPSLTVTQPTT